MPRRARLNLPGGVVHIVSRFARDEWHLDREGARNAYLSALAKAVERTDVAVLAYCLMSNHVHLVVVQGQTPLERFTKSVHTGFARWARRHRRGAARKAGGPIFADRPRMTLVDGDAYLLQVVRYVHNNPVRARVARFARSSAWSSHQAYIGRVPAPTWLAFGYVLARFGKGARAVARFDAFVDEGRREGRRPELSGAADATEAAQVRSALGDGHRVSDGILGSDDFVSRVLADGERVQAALSSRGSERRAGAIGRPAVREIIDVSLELYALDPVDLQERPRGRAAAQVKRLAIWVWIHEYRGRQIDIARALELDTSTVSRYYGQALARAGEFDELAGQVLALLRKRGKPRPRKVTRPAADAFPVRYLVDVDET